MEQQREHGSIPLAEIVASATNPRRADDPAALEELIDSVYRLGVLQPVLVRPRPKGGYELVCGHRRVEAARRVGLEEVPATVRDLDDAEVLEVQIVENLQRSNLHPLDEAEAVLALHATHKETVEEIATKLGKSESYVCQRLKLAALDDAVKTLFFEGRLTASVALQIARIPSLGRQVEAAHAVCGVGDHECMPAAEARRLILARFMTRLASAPFDAADADLVPEAGACGACSKRSGAQPNLFGDVDDANELCTDTACYELKKEALWRAACEEAQRKGWEVIGHGDRLFPYGNTLPHYSEYVDLDAECQEDAKGRAWRKVLGKPLPKIAIARDSAGFVHQLAKREEALRLAADKGLSWASVENDAVLKSARLDDRDAAEREMYGDADDDGADEEKPAEPMYDNDVLRAAVGEIATALEGGEAFLIDLVPALADAALALTGDPRALATRRGLDGELPQWAARRELRGLAKSAPDQRCRALLAEALLIDCLENAEDTEPIVAACSACGIDLDARQQAHVNALDAKGGE